MVETPKSYERVKEDFNDNPNREGNGYEHVLTDVMIRGEKGHYRINTFLNTQYTDSITGRETNSSLYIAHTGSNVPLRIDMQPCKIVPIEYDEKVLDHLVHEFLVMQMTHIATTFNDEHLYTYILDMQEQILDDGFMYILVEDEDNEDGKIIEYEIKEVYLNLLREPEMLKYVDQDTLKQLPNISKDKVC